MNRAMKMARLKMLVNVTAIILLTAFCSISEIRAAEFPAQVGEVVAVRGLVHAVDSFGVSRQLSFKDPVYAEDTLKTSASGRVQLMFADQTIISLGRNAEMEISSYEWSEKKKKGAMTTRVKEGAFRVMGGAITRSSPENFTTETPAATIGIRGSLYSGLVDGDMLWILFQAGTGIEVITPSGTEVITTPGFGSTVMVGEAPTGQEQFTPEEVQQLDDHFVPLEDPAGSDQPASPTGDPDTINTVSPLTDDAAFTDTATSDGTTDSFATDSLNNEVSQATSSVDGTVQISNDTTQNSTTATSPAPVIFSSGRYLSTLTKAVTPTVDTSWHGPVTGTNENGTFTGESTAQDATVIPISYPHNEYYPYASYTGVTDGMTSRIVYYVNDQYNYFYPMAYHSDSTGEFGFFTTADTYYDVGTYYFWEFGFAGLESVAADMPADGYSVYFGEFLGVPQETGTLEMIPAATGQMYTIVNWHSGKAMGFIDDGKPIMYFYGDVSGSSLINVTMISAGGDADTFAVQWHEGTGDFAQFYGSEVQGFGLTGSGSTYNIETQALMENWDLAGAGFLNLTMSELNAAAPTGTITLDGMVVGIAEDMTNPEVNRRIFMSHPFDGASSNFSITADQDAGTMLGTLNAMDIVAPSNVLKDIIIGGTYGSAYLDYDLAIGGLGCTTNCVESGTSGTGGLNTYGNYIATDGGPDRVIADHVSWGYWEIAYDDPTSGQPYHLHIPYSMWIAGIKTPGADIQDKVDTGKTGVYQGGAYGTWIEPSTPGPATAWELTNGATNLTVEFANTTDPVTGSITFDQATLTVGGNGGAVLPALNGFKTEISAVDIAGVGNSIIPSNNSEVNGFFFEPGAAAMGGNFWVITDNGDQLIGIMGGDLQP